MDARAPTTSAPSSYGHRQRPEGVCILYYDPYRCSHIHFRSVSTWPRRKSLVLPCLARRQFCPEIVISRETRATWRLFLHHPSNSNSPRDTCNHTVNCQGFTTLLRQLPNPWCLFRLLRRLLNLFRVQGRRPRPWDSLDLIVRRVGSFTRLHTTVFRTVRETGGAGSPRLELASYFYIESISILNQCD
jgi:hypothetical protein